MTDFNDYDPETAEIMRKISAWLETPEGVAHLQKMQEAVIELEKELRKQEEIDPTILFERITI
jgi:soluble cytochrome b562